MSNAYVVTIEGVNSLADFQANYSAETIASNARKAVNKTADRARTAGARAIRSEVNFPATYLDPSQGRLTVSKRASGDDLEAAITGRWRPTSLARFLVGSPSPGKAGVNLEVKPGHVTSMPRAFVMKLRAGVADIDTKFNLGLAIRLKPGESIRNKREMVKIAKNLYLIFGPSVSQTWKGVANDIAPDTANFLENEFVRLMNLGAPRG